MLNIALGTDRQTNDLRYYVLTSINRRWKESADDDDKPDQSRREGGVSISLWNSEGSQNCRKHKTGSVSNQNRRLEVHHLLSSGSSVGVPLEPVSDAVHVVVYASRCLHLFCQN
jgi:hypothetical protein